MAHVSFDRTTLENSGRRLLKSLEEHCNVWNTYHNPTHISIFPLLVKKSTTQKKLITQTFQNTSTTRTLVTQVICSSISNYQLKMSATVDMSIVIAAIENVPIAHKVSILEALFKATKPSMKESAKAEKAEKAGKAPKEKKEKDPNAPKKEANWWIQGTQNVITRLQALLPENADELKKPIVRTNIPKLLKERGELTKDTLPTDEQITQAFKDFKEDPTIQARFAEARAAKKADKKKDSDSESEASAQHKEAKETKEKKPRKPRAKKADTTSSDSSITQFVPSTQQACEAGYGMIDGLKYRLVDGDLNSGCFVYIGDECKGFYFDGAIDSSIQP